MTENNLQNRNVWDALQFATVLHSVAVPHGQNTGSILSQIGALYGHGVPLTLSARAIVSLMAGDGPLDAASVFACRVLDTDTEARKAKPTGA